MIGAADDRGPVLARVTLVVYAAFAAAFAFVLARVLADPGAIAQTDFTAFQTGWWLILHGRGGALYDVAAQQEAQRVLTGGAPFPSGLLAFLHPPHAALAGVPLGLLAAWLGAPVAFRVWTAVNLVLLVSLARDLGRLAAPDSRAGRGLVAAALAGAFPVFLTLREGQVALLLAVAFARVCLAVEARRPAAAAAWLLVLSIKPQLVPIPLVLLAAFRQWRVLALAASAGTVAVAASLAVLGPDIFGRYLRGLEALQAHLGRGTPGAMLNLRGLLVRAAGPAHTSLATALAFAACGVAAVAWGLAWGRAPDRARWRGAFASAAAAALFFSPHLFVGDLTLWAVPLALAVSTQAGVPARRLTTFALAWPLAIAVTISIDRWPRLFFETATGLALVATIVIARLARPAPMTRA